jgi:hypothetical protein
MAEGWLEERTRIPLAGIIAIVIIVGVVALFMRAELTRYVFPSSTVEVIDTAAEGANARGSASFAGERDIPLAYKERLEGVLTTTEGSLSVQVDAAARSLTLVRDGEREEVILSPSEDGTGLVADFEFDATQTRVRVDPAARSLTLARDGLPVVVTLTDAVSYDGAFTHAGKDYGLRFAPGGPSALVTHGGGMVVVPLARAGQEYSGVWSESQGDHPVRIDAEKLVATIGELW